MKVFSCIITGDEMFSDSYPHNKVFGDSMYEVRGKYVTKGSDQIAIACDDEIDESAGGETVVDIVDAANLNEVPFSKKDFMTVIKVFLKNVSAKLEAAGKADRIPIFKKGATEAVKFIVGRFDEFQIFLGSSLNDEGSLAFAYQKEQTDDGPTFLFFIDVLKEEKF